MAGRDDLEELALGADDVLRVEDVVRMLHLSRNTVYKLAREGTLPSYRMGRQIRFRRDDVLACMHGGGTGVSGVGAAGFVNAAGSPVGPLAAPPAFDYAAPASFSDGSWPALDAAGAQPLDGTLAAASPAGAARQPSAACAPAASPALLTSPRPDVLDALPAWMQNSLVIGGQDMACDVLANLLPGLGIQAVRSHANGYVSLARMYLGTVHAAAVSLWSGEEERYNVPFVRAMLPGVPVTLVRLLKRRVGFTVRKRGEMRPGRWSDLLREGVVIANRERGASSRVLLDEHLGYLEADPSVIAGYNRVVESEFAQALLVARGAANVAVTSEVPARRMAGLDFLPMQEEVLDLAIARTPQTRDLLRAVRSLLRTDAFRSEFDPTLYDTFLMGEVIYEA